ncbi:MAG: hypothetical protein GY775_05380 [Candidatus Scalindua sp.]|nr:hypothetical protein [Candidatus Scalindua sp.]
MDMAGVGVEMSSLMEIGQLYLDMQDELANLRTEVQSLREADVESGRRLREMGGVVEELRAEVERVRREATPRVEGGEKGKPAGLWRTESPRTVVGKSRSDVGSWRVASTRATGITISRQPMTGVQTSNPFSALRDECQGDVDQESSRKVSRVSGSGERVGKDREVKSRKSRKVFLAGDSQVRYLDSAMQAEVSKQVCLPGGGIRSLVGKLDSLMEDEKVSPIVCLSVGGNDVHRKKSEELLKEYKDMLDTIVRKRGSPVVCGIVPRRGLNREWMSRTIAFNNRLEMYCKSKAIPFIDCWSQFFGDDTLYARDGVHFSRRGVQVLASNLDRVLVGFP